MGRAQTECGLRFLINQLSSEPKSQLRFVATIGRVASPRPAPSTRRDAVRNREALTAAATAAFREEGLDIPVDEIARRAGVGVATLYRHFPAKPDLIVAVTESVLDDLGAAAAAALAAGGDVLRDFLAAALEQQHANRGFLEALGQAGLPDAARAALAGRVLTMLAPIVAAAHAAGTLHADLDADDLLVAIRMLGATTATPGTRPPRPARHLAVVLGGLARPARA
jgi:AcrR family transcriptional regulator